MSGHDSAVLREEGAVVPSDRFGWVNPKSKQWVDWNLRRLSASELLANKQKGIELEFFVLWPDLTPVEEAVADRLLEAMNARFPNSTAFEANGSQREFHSQPYFTAADVMAETRTYFAGLKEYADQEGLVILLHSLHPTALSLEGSNADFIRLITDEKHGLLATELAANCSLQVNLEVIDPDALLYCHNQWRRVLPLIAALTASSPVWSGKRTGSMSSASYLRRIRHDGGLPFRYDLSVPFAERLEREIQFTDIGAVYSHPFIAHNMHLRLRVDRGCIEVSIADVPLNLADVEGFLELCEGINRLFVLEYVEGVAKASFLGPHEDIALQKGLGLAWLKGMGANVYVENGSCRVVSAKNAASIMLDVLRTEGLLTDLAGAYVEERLSRGSDAEHLLAQMGGEFNAERFAALTLL